MQLAQDRDQWQVLKLEILDISTALLTVKYYILKPSGNYMYHLLLLLKQDRQCTYESNIEARSRNHRYRAKATATCYGLVGPGIESR